jgi:hypothetical protein
MSTGQIIFTLIYTIVSIITYGPIFDSKTIYKQNFCKFSNFSIGHFIIFFIFLPIELLYIVFTSKKGLIYLLSKKPFQKFKFSIGDRVNQGGTIREVTDIRLSDEGKEMIKLSGYRDHQICYYYAENLDKLTPLEEAMK